MDTNHIWMYPTHIITDKPKENPEIYCRKLDRVLPLTISHYEDECSDCPYFNGSAQGYGVECLFNDGSNLERVKNQDPFDLMYQTQRNVILNSKYIEFK